jgi:hypothetical protein
MAKTIVIIASAFLFTVLGLATGIAVNLLKPDSSNSNAEFTVISTVLPTAGGALFGACVGAFAVGMGSRSTKN